MVKGTPKDSDREKNLQEREEKRREIKEDLKQDEFQNDEFERFKFAQSYHMGELYYRRNRQWQVFQWAMTALSAILAASIALSGSNHGLSRIQAVGIIFIVLFLGLFACLQIEHDRRVADLHWERASSLHLLVPVLGKFRDDQKKIWWRPRHVRVLAIFTVCVAILIFLVSVPTTNNLPTGQLPQSPQSQPTKTP